VPEKFGRTVFVKGMLSGLVNVRYGVQRIYNFFPSYLCSEDVFRDTVFIMYTQFFGSGDRRYGEVPKIEIKLRSQ
jgi:hypothetical protein